MKRFMITMLLMVVSLIVCGCGNIETSIDEPTTNNVAEKVITEKYVTEEVIPETTIITEKVVETSPTKTSNELAEESGLYTDKMVEAYQFGIADYHRYILNELKVTGKYDCINQSSMSVGTVGSSITSFSINWVDIDHIGIDSYVRRMGSDDELEMYNQAISDIARLTIAKANTGLDNFTEKNIKNTMNEIRSTLDTQNELLYYNIYQEALEKFSEGYEIV